MKTASITAERVRELLDYDPETGWLVWRKRSRSQFNSKWAGKRAGMIHHLGYRIVSLGNVVHVAHRLAWMHFHGVMPKQLDHINRDRDDNRLANLRECSTSENQANIAPKSDNTSGYKGVCWNAQSRKWQAGIKQHGKSCHLGLYDKIEDAAAAYATAARERFGQFARTA